MDFYQIIIDVIMALIIAILVILGIKRGFVKSFFKSTKIIFVILITVLIGSFVVSLCQEMFVGKMIEGRIGDKLVARAERETVSFGVDQMNEELPSIVKKILPMNEIEEYLINHSGSSSERARAIGNKIEESLVILISNILGYMIAFVISFFICSIAIFLLEKIFELPVLGWLNRVGGLFWGVANAYLVTSFLVCVVVLIFGSDFVNETFITKLIYNFGLFTF